MDVISILSDPAVVFAGAGVVGGLVRTCNFRIENPDIKFNPWKVARNIIVGGVCGYAMGGNILIAFTSGLSGEWLVQKVVSKTDTKVGLSEKIPKLKSIVQ